MKPLFYLAITYFLASGVPVEADPVPAYHQNGEPVTEKIECLEMADEEYRKFHRNIAKAEGCLFIDIRVECVTK